MEKEPEKTKTEEPEKVEKPEPKDVLFYRPSELAEILGITHQTVLNWIRQGKIKAKKLMFGRIYRIPKEEFEKILKDVEITKEKLEEIKKPKEEKKKKDWWF